MMDKEKSILLNRLSAWEDELKTDKHKMRKYAERAIRLIKEEINRRWPGEIKESS